MTGGCQQRGSARAHQRLLLLSSSRVGTGAMLEYARGALDAFLGGVRSLAFIPYAGVRIAANAYTARVREALAPLGPSVQSVHAGDPLEVLDRAGAIVVGGGNTFVLLEQLARHALLDAIAARVWRGVPYVGWSAGANIACPTIMTTNDMPIVQPPTFRALGLVPFQINPHYTDVLPPEHRGETRAERIAEFVALHPTVPVVGLREGSMLRVEGSALTLLGDERAVLFVAGAEPREVGASDALQRLMLPHPARSASPSAAAE